jgi:hypothetical protein
MDKKALAKLIVFALVWINAFLTQQHLKTIPVLDETQVAFGLAFIYSAYEWIKHAYIWIRDNWVKKNTNQKN